MPGSDWDSSVVLYEWAEQECRHLDLIASWETLMSVYSMLGFVGPDSDEERLAEFKTVIGEMNKFLTRMRKGLNSARDVEAAVEFLGSHANTSDMNLVKTRASIAYNKLKQQWIKQSIVMLSTAIRHDTEGKRDDD